MIRSWEKEENLFFIPYFYLSDFVPTYGRMEYLPQFFIFV